MTRWQQVEKFCQAALELEEKPAGCFSWSKPVPAMKNCVERWSPCSGLTDAASALSNSRQWR